MCGIFGWINQDNPEKNNEVAILASDRGIHSFGYAYFDNGLQVIKKKGNIKLHKNTIPKTDKLIGHQRLATFGGIELDNGCPFMTEDFAFVHNGNIRDYQELANKYSYELKSGCDSEVLIPIIKDNTEKIISELSGPFAIAIISQDQIILLRRGLPIYSNGAVFCSKKFPDSFLIPENQLIYVKENIQEKIH